MSVKEEVVLIGANKQPSSVDFSANFNIVAFGAHTTVALWDPFSKYGVFATLKGHTKEVTGVKFIPDSNFLVSTSEDGDAIVWEKTVDNTFSQRQVLKFHQGSISCVSTCANMIVTGGVDGKIAIWKYQSQDSSFVLEQTFCIKKNFLPTCLAIQQVYGEHLIAIGGTSVDVYVCKSSDPNNYITLKGHEDWMKCLSWNKDGDSYLLASGCQDRYIRLWRLRPHEPEDENKLVLLANKKEKMTLINNQVVEMFSEALIMGHDDWVSSLVWKGTQLLSASADTALMIWEMDIASGIWVCTSRLGEMSIKGASTATGSSGGFWSCLWIDNIANNSQMILANGKTGSFRAYEKSNTEPCAWKAKLAITGPMREVTDLVWGPCGEYLFATSLDQTTRLIAPTEHYGWRELARPQIHGYDMICLDNISSTKFVSGGDEKILRVFEMTNSTFESLKQQGIEIGVNDSLPENATLPVLGLSNKAENEVTEENEQQQQQPEDQDEETNNNNNNNNDDNNTTTNNNGLQEGIPNEDVLQRFTLFPELEKLYGHGYEITCCASNAKYIASACRSNTARHAVIRVFDTANYSMCHVLEGHNLTITSLAFSPDGEYLIAVSRDRQLSIWKNFELVSISQAHSRIIWDCTWVNNQYFITGSRDKSIKVWKLAEESNGEPVLVTQTKFDSAVTSVDAYNYNGLNYLAVGLEKGIVIQQFEIAKSQLNEILTFNQTITPADKVAKLAWGKPRNGSLMLAVGSSDHSIRLYSIDI